MKRIIVATLALVALASSVMAAAPAAQAPLVGDGSSGNPYQLTRRAHLVWLSTNMAAGLRLGQNTYKYYKMMNDIDMNDAGTPNDGGTDCNTWTFWGTGSTGTGFKPIGEGWLVSAGNPTNTDFTGKFDGNGFHIRNLYSVNTATTSRVGAGLFGCISALNGEGASIVNLGLVNATVTGAGKTGGLVGVIFPNADTASGASGVISNCFFDGKVSGTNSSVTGGLVGRAEGNPFAVITDCYVRGSVQNASASHCGAFIGQIDNGASSVVSQVRRCYAAVTMSGGTNATSGGFISTAVGMTSANLSNCYMHRIN